MPIHLKEHIEEGRHIPGIFILKRNMLMREIIDELTLIWGAAEPDEYTDDIKYLPIT